MWVVYHIVVYVQLVSEEVDVKEQAQTEGHPTLGRGRVEVEPFEDCCQAHVHYGHFMELVKDCSAA